MLDKIVSLNGAKLNNSFRSHGLIDDGSWLLPLLKDPEKNRQLLISRCSRDTEAYVKIGKNLDDLESRELREKLKRYREEAEAEAEKQSQPASVALSDSAKVAWPDSKSGSISSNNLLCNFAKKANKTDFKVYYPKGLRESSEFFRSLVSSAKLQSSKKRFSNSFFDFEPISFALSDFAMLTQSLSASDLGSSNAEEPHDSSTRVF